MGKTQTRLTVRAAQWSQLAASMLERAMLCDPSASVYTLERLVDSGGGALFEVLQADRVVGFVVLRIDRAERFPVGVIVAAAGRLPGADLIASVLPEIESRFVGVSRIRVHTARPGLLKKLARHGYGFQEFVLGKTIARRQPAQQQQGGGGGSSSSAETTTQNIDKRLVVDQGIGISSDSSTVNVSALDGGAIASAVELSKSSVGAAIDLSALSVDRVLTLAGEVFKGGFKSIDQNAALLDKSSGFIDKAYADAKGSGAERFYIAVGVVAAVAIVAVKAGTFK